MWKNLYFIIDYMAIFISPHVTIYYHFLFPYFFNLQPLFLKLIYKYKLIPNSVFLEIRVVTL